MTKKSNITSEMSIIDSDTVELLVSRLEEYELCHLARAVFCWSSFIGNRDHVFSTIHMNAALAELAKNPKGTRTICTYKEFVDFVRRLERMLDFTFDDPQPHDAGEFVIPFNGALYRTFVNSETTFAQTVSLPALASYLHLEKPLSAILAFVDRVVACSAKSQDMLESDDCSDLNIPPRAYFEAVCHCYASLCDGLDNNSLVRRLTCGNPLLPEFVTFLSACGKLLPLFNPCLVSDLMETILSNKGIPANKTIALKALHQSFTTLFASAVAPLSHGSVYGMLAKPVVYKNISSGPGKEIASADYLLWSNDVMVFVTTDLTLDTVQLENILRSAFEKDRIGIKYMENGVERPVQFSKMEQPQLVVLRVGPSLSANHELPTGKGLTWPLLGFIALLHLSESFDDLVHFIYDERSQVDQWSISGGLAGKYVSWVSMGKTNQPGAIAYDSVFYELGIGENRIVERYRDFSRYSFIVSAPPDYSYACRWIKREEHDGFALFSDKGRDNNVVLFSHPSNGTSLNLLFDFSYMPRMDLTVFEGFSAFQKLIACYVVLFEDSLVRAGFYSRGNWYISFSTLFHPIEGGARYVFCTQVEAGESFHSLILTADCMVLLTDLSDASTNEIECDFFIEFLRALNQKRFFDIAMVEKEVNRRRGEPMEVVARSVAFDYYVSQRTHFTRPTAENAAGARRALSYAVKEAGIDSGTYADSEQTRKTREIQLRFLPALEKEVASFDQAITHSKFLSLLSAALFEYRSEQRKVYQLAEENIGLKTKNELYERKTKCEENYHGYIKSLYYLIDLNLSCEHTSNVIPGDDAIQRMLAKAFTWLDYQYASDAAYYYPKGTSSLDVAGDYLPSIESDSTTAERIKTRIRERGEGLNYIPPIDRELLLEKASNAFKEDTGIALTTCLAVCRALGSASLSPSLFKEIDINVFRCGLEELKQTLRVSFQSDNTFNDEGLNAVLSYLTIDGTKIRRIDGKLEEFVPVWEREKRNQRFEVRPLYVTGGLVYFSPIVLNEYVESWLRGLPLFYMPYELGLPTLRATLNKEKSNCEHRFETDIADFLRKKGLRTEHSLDLIKRFPKQRFEDVGDYDILAVDDGSKIVYNIEAKFVTYVGTIREWYNQQDTYFSESHSKKSKAQRFERRIRYLLQNKETILRTVFGIERPHDYRIVNFMVTNKVFRSDRYDVSFDIKTFVELKKLFEKK